MNSKQCAKLAFGNPGFFDFLGPVATFAKQAVQSLSPTTGLANAIVQKYVAPKVQNIPQARDIIGNLDTLATVAGGASGAVLAGGVAIPALAGVSLPSLGSLGAIGGGSGALEFLTGDDSVDSDPFNDTFDDDDSGPDEE